MLGPEPGVSVREVPGTYLGSAGGNSMTERRIVMVAFFAFLAVGVGLIAYAARPTSTSSVHLASEPSTTRPRRTTSTTSTTVVTAPKASTTKPTTAEAALPDLTTAKLFKPAVTAAGGSKGVTVAGISKSSGFCTAAATT